jgi:hypothetical protein
MTITSGTTTLMDGTTQVVLAALVIKEATVRVIPRAIKD